MKKYSRPFSSAPRGLRVVYEMENSRFGICVRSFSTRVDLPDPDGAEIIKTLVITQYFAPVRGLSRSQLSSPVPLRLFSWPHPQVPRSSKAPCSPPDLVLAEGSPTSSRLRQWRQAN